MNKVIFFAISLFVFMGYFHVGGKEYFIQRALSVPESTGSDWFLGKFADSFSFAKHFLEKVKI